MLNGHEACTTSLVVDGKCIEEEALLFANASRHGIAIVQEKSWILSTSRAQYIENDLSAFRKVHYHMCQSSSRS